MIHALVIFVLAVTSLPARTDQMIYDTAGVIDDAAEQRLERDVHELYAKSGVSIVVVTVPALTDETIDAFALRVGETWGVGKRGQDRGLVVAFSRDDRKIYVATGYGTEGYLNDARVGQLLDRHAIPALRANRFSDGLTGLVDGLVAVSAKEFNVTITGARPPPPEPGPLPSSWTLILGALGILLLLVLARRNPLALLLFMGGGGFGRGFGNSGFGGGFGSGGFGGGGFGGGGAGRSF